MDQPSRSPDLPSHFGKKHRLALGVDYAEIEQAAFGDMIRPQPQLRSAVFASIARQDPKISAERALGGLRSRAPGSAASAQAGAVSRDLPSFQRLERALDRTEETAAPLRR